MEMFREEKLEKIRLGIARAISDTVLLDADVEQVRDYICNDIHYRVQGFIWGQRQPDRIISYPASWWEAFKERWFPLALLRRFPVEYIEYTISATVLYPEYHVAIPGQKNSILLHMANNHGWGKTWTEKGWKDEWTKSAS